MARFNSYQWDHNIGVCLKHMLPEIPCPACLQNAENEPDLYIVLEPIEHWLERDEISIPQGFNPKLHSIV